ncbi:MAG TPA: zinc-binding dehydrogenase [Longimicrobiaceae bacterium]|nr:zinc-binding dehydrogenase [Longimicrobiaceae bacterium]
MFAAIFHEFGTADVVRYEEVPMPVPGPGELLVEVRAAAFNHLDVWVRRGLPIETTMPHIGGSDVAGVVVGRGEMEAFSEGARVVVNPALWCGRCRECARGEESMCELFRILGEHTNGGFAQYVAVPAANAYEIPPEITFEAAACLPISYQTAWRALVSRARLRPGEDVLVVGASGGTAIAAIQIAKLAGARVFALTSGPENVARVRALGADVVYDRLEVEFSRALAADTAKRGVDVVVENVGAPTWEGSIRSLAPGGRLVTYGATGGPKVEIDIRRLFWKQFEIIGTTMASRGEFEAMLRAAWAGKLTPVIDSVLPLARAAEGHRRIEEGDQFGKIVLQPSRHPDA